MDLDLLPPALDRFARDLTVAGEPAILDAIVARHLQLFLDLRQAGLRWPAIMRLLGEAGARRPDGSHLSSDQIRASVSRARRCQVARLASIETTAPLAPRDVPISAATTPRPPPANRSSSSSPSVAPSRRHAAPILDPDLTSAELDAVRRRLR